MQVERLLYEYNYSMSPVKMLIRNYSVNSLDHKRLRGRRLLRAQCAHGADPSRARALDACSTETLPPRGPEFGARPGADGGAEKLPYSFVLSSTV